MRSFSDKVIAYMGSGLIDSALQVISGMLLVRYMTKFEYGTFRQIMLLAVLISSIIAVGLPQSLSYFIPRATSLKEKKQHAFQTFWILSFLGGIASLICFMLRTQTSIWFNNNELLSYVGTYCLFFLFILPSKVTQPVLIAYGETTFASMINAATSLANFCAIVIPVILRQPIETTLTSMLVIYGIKYFIDIIILHRLAGGKAASLNLPMLYEQFKYGLPLGASIIIGVTRRYVDQFIIAVFYNPVNFALYARGAFELPFVAVLPFTLSTLMIPKIAEYQQDNNVSKTIYLWQESMRKISLVFFPLFVYSFVFADQMISVLFTREYLESVSIFRVYLLMLPMRIIAYRTVLQAMGKTKPILHAVIISLFISVITGILLERLIGFCGPATAVVLGEITSSAYMLYNTHKELDVSMATLLPIKQLLPQLLCALGVGIAVFPISLATFTDFALLCLSFPIYFGLYLVTMKVFRVLTVKDWDLLHRWMTLRVLRQGH